MDKDQRNINEASYLVNIRLILDFAVSELVGIFKFAIQNIFVQQNSCKFLYYFNKINEPFEQEDSVYKLIQLLC